MAVDRTGYGSAGAWRSSVGASGSGAQGDGACRSIESLGSLGSIASFGSIGSIAALMWMSMLMLMGRGSALDRHPSG